MIPYRDRNDHTIRPNALHDPPLNHAKPTVKQRPKLEPPHRTIKKHGRRSENTGITKSVLKELFWI